MSAIHPSKFSALRHVHNHNSARRSGYLENCFFLSTATKSQGFRAASSARGIFKGVAFTEIEDQHNEYVRIQKYQPEESMVPVHSNTAFPFILIPDGAIVSPHNFFPYKMQQRNGMVTLLRIPHPLTLITKGVH